MNELEKALEQLNIKYETNGKQYKIPTTRENLVELLKGYIAMTINLQSKIDKVNEFLEELKHNQNINLEKWLENRVDMDYVIERLEDILGDDK